MGTLQQEPPLFLRDGQGGWESGLRRLGERPREARRAASGGQGVPACLAPPLGDQGVGTWPAAWEPHGGALHWLAVDETLGAG